MSIRVMTAVWADADVAGGELLVLLAMADWADDDGGKCFPKQETLARKARMTDRGVRKCLASLTEKGYIVRSGRLGGGPIEWTVRSRPEQSSDRNPSSGQTGTPVPTYPSSDPPVEDSLRSPSTSATARGEDQSKPKTPGAEHAPLLTGRLVDLMFVNDPKAKIPKASSASYKRWLDSARLLIDADGRDPDETMKVIEWCQRDEFWKGNILSMPKFREKYPQLRARWLVHGRAKVVNEPGRSHVQQSTSSADLARAYGRSDRERRAGLR